MMLRGFSAAVKKQIQKIAVKLVWMDACEFNGDVMLLLFVTM